MIAGSRALAAAALAAAAACADPTPPPATGPTADGSGEIGLDPRPASAEGVLAYATALSADGEVWVTAELDTHFELVVRDVPGRGREPRERLRAHLGPHAYDVRALELGPRARYAWVASADATVRAIDVHTGETAATWRMESAATAVAISPDGRYAATGSARGILCLRRTRDGALLHCAAAHGAAISDLDAARPRPRARRTASAGLDAERAAFLLASASEDGDAALWALPSLAELGRATGDPAHAVALCPRGARVAIARGRRVPSRAPDLGAPESTRDPSARVEIYRSGDLGAREGPRALLRGHRGPIAAVSWLQSACEHVISGSWDASVAIWSRRGDLLAQVGEFGHTIRDVSAVRSRAAIAAWGGLGGGEAAVILDIHAGFAETPSAR